MTPPISSAARNGEEAQRVLEERARLLARALLQHEARVDVLQAVVFRLGGERYALSTCHVLEVLRLSELTVLPGAPPHVAGVFNRRGEILPVFDLRRLFVLGPDACPEATRLLILGDERAELGILAETADEVIGLAASDLHEPPPTAGGIDRHWIQGVTQDVLILLAGRELLADPRLFLDVGKGARET